MDLLSSVRPILEHDGIPVTCEDVTLAPADSDQGIGLSLNGRSLEDLLRESDRAQFLCHSSKCQPYQSSVEVIRDQAGERCIRAPEILFRKAILLSLEEP